MRWSSRRCCWTMSRRWGLTIACGEEAHDARVGLRSAVARAAFASRPRPAIAADWAAARLAAGRPRAEAVPRRRRDRGACRACPSAASSAISIARSASSRRKCCVSKSSRKTKTRARRSSAAASCTSCGNDSSPNGRSAATAASRRASARRARAVRAAVRGGAAHAVARRRPRSSAPACSDRRSAPASRIACSRWKPSVRLTFVERLLEFPLQGDFTFRTSDGRRRTRHAERQDRSDRRAGRTGRCASSTTSRRRRPT